MKFKGGIHQDSQPVNQPEGTWRVAKNIVIDGPGNVVNEEGFNLTTGFPTDRMLIGQIPVTGDRVVVFLVDAPTGENFSEIGIINGAATYTQLYADSTVLQFHENYPVSGDFIFNGDGELIILFTDNRKDIPPKLFNLLQADTLITVSSGNLTSLFPNTSIPSTNVSAVNSGGSLPTGAYQFAFSYELPDGSSTNWLSLTNPVMIYDGSVADTYNIVDGSKPGSNAGKSIGMTLSNVDTRYAKIKMAVVKKIDGIITAEDVSSFVITDAVIRVIYTGDEITTDLLLEEILADRAIFDRIKSMKILNDRLYLGNVSQTNITDYQQYANNIALKWYGRDQISMDAAKTSHKDPITIYTKRSFMPGEVYAFYIRFILNNGSTSPAFHIPGRPPNLVYDHINNIWVSNSAPVDEDSVETLTEFTSINTRARYFHFYETGDATLKDFFDNAITIGGNLGYWENLDERYTSLEYDSSGDGGRNLLAEGLNTNAVKHHKFPSLTKLESWGFPIMTEDVSQTGPVSQLSIDTKWETSVFLSSAFEQSTHYVVYTNDTGEELINTSLNLSGILNLTVGNFPNIPQPPSDWSIAMMVFIGPYSQYKNVILDSEGYKLWNDNVGGYLPNTNNQIFVLDAAEFSWINSIAPWENPAGNWSVGSHVFNTSYSSLTIAPGDQISAITYRWKNSSNFPDSEYDSKVPGGVYTDNGINNLYGTSTIDIVGEGIISGTVFGTKYGHPLGIIAQNIVIPEEIRNNIQGFEFLYAEKTISNSLSLGTSVIFNGINPTDVAEVVDPGDYVRLYPPDMLEFKPNNKPTHIKWELQTQDRTGGELTWKDAATKGYGGAPDAGFTNDGAVLGTISDMVMYDWNIPASIIGWPGTTKHFIRQITNAQYLPVDNSSAIINNAFREAAYYAEIPNGYESSVSTARFMVSLQIFKDNLYNSLYEQNLVATGKIFSVSPGVGDYIFGRNERGQPIYGGDTYLNPYFQVITRPSTTAEEDIGITSTPGDSTKKGVITVFAWPTFSAINTGLYNKGDAWWETYYPKSLTSRVSDMPTGFITPSSYISTEGIPHIEGGGSVAWAPKTKGHYFMTIPEGKYYNNDFTTINTLEAGNIPFDPLVNYLEEFPQLVARSLKANRVEPMANIRKFLADDVFEMPKNRGEIWHIDALGDMLLIHHEYALFRTVGKEVLKMGVTEVTVGTGDIFEREPKEVIPSSPGGVAGTMSKYAAFTCRLGYFFVDQKQGKVFLLTDSLRELSAEGLRIFFRDNMPLNSDQDNPYSGIGMTAAYDRKYNRIVLSKVGVNPWTVSFSADNDAWVSFHDYNPAALFSADTLFSAKSENIWKHNAGNRCLFYDQAKPAVTSIDTVFIGNLGSGISAAFSNIYWQADLVDSGGVYLRTTPLTSVFIYNNNQASGTIILNSSNTNTNVRNVHNLWKFNKFRDIAVRGDVVLGPPFYNINTTALDPALVWWKRKRFMDQFMITRLTYDNTDQNTLYLYSVETDTLPLLR